MNAKAVELRLVYPILSLRQLLSRQRELRLYGRLQGQGHASDRSRGRQPGIVGAPTPAGSLGGYRLDAPALPDNAQGARIRGAQKDRVPLAARQRVPDREHLVFGVVDEHRHVADLPHPHLPGHGRHSGAAPPSRPGSRAGKPASGLWFEIRFPSLKTTNLSSMCWIGCTACGPWPTIAVISGEAISVLARSSWPELGCGWYSGTIPPPQWRLTITASAPSLRARFALGQHPGSARGVDRPRVRRGDPVGIGRVGEERELDAIDPEDQRPALGRRGRKRSRVPDVSAVERLQGFVDPGLALIEGVVRSGVAQVPSGRRDPLRERGRRVEDRVARRRRGGHRRLHVTDAEVGPRHKGLSCRAPPRSRTRCPRQRQRPLPDRRVDQQIAADRDREPGGPRLARGGTASRGRWAWGSVPRRNRASVPASADRKARPRLPAARAPQGARPRRPVHAFVDRVVDLPRHRASPRIVAQRAAAHRPGQVGALGVGSAVMEAATEARVDRARTEQPCSSFAKSLFLGEIHGEPRVSVAPVRTPPSRTGSGR